MDARRIVEPLARSTRTKCARSAANWASAAELLDRHPFPGPGLAIRCLCAEDDEPVSKTPEGWLIPVRSVGVQGDSRSYAPVLAIDRFPSATAHCRTKPRN